MVKLDEQEKMSLIKEAVQDVKVGNLSPFAFAMVVGSIVDQQEVSLEDLGWGAQKLAAIRGAVEHSVQRTPSECTHENATPVLPGFKECHDCGMTVRR